MNRPVVNRMDFIQKFSDNNSHEFSMQDLNEISIDFNYMYDRLQMLKNEQFSVFEFQEFIQHLHDKDFPAAQMSLKGALREYKYVFDLYNHLEQKKDLENKLRTQLNSNLSSRSRDPSFKEASPYENDNNQTDANESDRKEDKMRISSYHPTVPHSSEKAHAPRSGTDKSTEHVYDSDTGAVQETGIDKTPAEETHRSRDLLRDTGAVQETGIDKKPAQETHRSRDLLRRSEEASLLLRQGNPNIADLSDTNRPTNLAERFSELYSNEYTEAFEFLQNHGQYAYKYCRQLASEELEERIHNILQERIGSNEFTDYDKEDILVKGLAAKKLKMDAPGLKNYVCDSFVWKEFWSLIPKEIDPINEKLVTYGWNCADIVWFMCVQDPPISMSWVKKGDTFDTFLYRAYTKNGSTVDFCVWPLVLLTDSGPVLTKGIAQGK
ncbi:hypothetical protein CHS0354_026424 [Potamilus streckersoni]|uniref:Mitochondria-eating protein C-terminal domain-containing protein n=1 Tax=Potamilus streckersoni TaxID=2493646 RepID=A0AAE0W6G7_9BIVA|nr:hypothetical protein CHS0354_026424 [Potamilus streckersoni]